MAEYYIGLISGTSMDGIDAVLCDFSIAPPSVIAAGTLAFDSAQRELLDRLRADPDRFPAAEAARLDGLLGDAFATAALTLLERAGVAAHAVSAIGSHGQTVLHRPDAHPPFTWQIADPYRIAAASGILTVADFRRADLAAGGQGAPLAPLIHQALLASADENRVVVNLGGIANITILPAAGGVRGFDTGPANCFLDLWYRRHHDGRFDHAGAWAASGQADPGWLSTLLEDDYFGKRPPKSTGIEHFSTRWLDQRLPDWAASRPADVQATLLEFTAVSVADAIRRLPSGEAPKRVIACGGGAHNRHLLARLSIALNHEVPVCCSADLGVDPDHIEAILFAWLARERLARRRLATPAITGARGPVLAGTLFHPPERID